MIKIAHIADIHWRGLSRHEEYRAVFEQFFQKCKELEPDIIYIGGDIVHSKTQNISPELIENLTWWFKSMAKIAPTHVILGNHDGIMLNKDRQDAVTPIVEAIDSDNIFLYKKSGVYPTGFEGFNWCIFSCFDEEGWRDVHPVKGEVNFALFHGAVNKSETDSNWALDGDVELDFFDGYDFALLGDIHKTQFLNEERTIAYPGSTIQQNYGESVEKGFLLWEIESKENFTVKFHPLKPYSPFITIDWAGNVKDTVDVAKGYPKKSRIRIRHKETIPHVDIKQLVNTINENLDASEVVFKDDRDMSGPKNFTINNNKLDMLDLTDPAIHIDLFKEFYKDETIEKDIWSGLELLIQEKVKTAAHLDSSARNVKWSLLNMKFDNTFGYGKNNHINFDGMSGITGIFGRNARGKSSIIGTLLYTLFNTSDRGPIKNLHIVNTRKNYCRSSIDLKYKGDKYRVERQTVKHKGRKSIMTGTTHLNFFKLDENDEEIKDHSGEQRRETEKVVRNMLGEAEDFLLTSIASQGDINAFIKERATARKKVLTKFLGLTIFETMLENARKESNDLKIQLKNMPAREWQHVIAEKAKAKRESTAKIKELESDLEVLRKKEQTLIVSISKHNNSKIITPRDVERKELLLKETIEKANSIKLTKEAALEEKKKIEDEIRKIKAFIVSENYDELKVKLEKQASLEKEIVKLKHKIKIEEQTLNNQVKSAELLKEVPCGDKFLTCKFISESHKKSKLIDSQVEKINTLKENLSVLKTVFSGIEQEKIKEKIKEVESEKARLNLFETNVIRHERKEYEIGAKLKLIVEQIKREKEHLDEMKANVKQVDIDDALEKSKSLLEEIQASIKEKDSHRLAEAGIIGRAERDLEALKKERDRYMKIRKKWKVYEYFMKAISKTGIPLQITMSQLPIINSEIAKILQSVFSFTVEIEADDMSNAMDVYINYGDSRRIIEVGSGMEKMVASLAIRVALANISSLPKPDIFIIDEGFGVLDGVNVEAINRLLVSLKKWFKNILIITHIDSIKDVADNIIEITVNGHDSNVVYE